ncbi:MAG: hypothetical protein ACHQYQ_07600 [Bacteriovoracales bacterium]
MKFIFLTFILVSCGKNPNPNPNLLSGLVPLEGTYSSPILPTVSENNNICGLNPYRTSEGYCIATKDGRKVRVGGGCCN